MNIKDIANLSGYSVATVSRVLNGHTNVSTSAHDKIMSVVNQYNFEPNANARELKRNEKDPIAVIVKGRNNLLFADIIEIIHTTLDAIGEEVYVAYLDEDENEVRFALRHQMASNPRGILFLGGELEYFKQYFGMIACPCVLITNSTTSLSFPNLSCVLTNDEQASFDIVNEIIKAGHQSIGIVGGNLSQGQISARRLSGAIRCMACHNIGFNIHTHYEPSRFSMQEGYDAFKRLITRTPDITAVYALGDVIAIGAMRAAIDSGYSLPCDMSFASFDGIQGARFCVPRLTTVRQDSTLLAQYGVSTLLKMMSTAEPLPVCCIVPHVIQQGESIIKPRT